MDVLFDAALQSRQASRQTYSHPGNLFRASLTSDALVPSSPFSKIFKLLKSSWFPRGTRLLM
jgi:hypothetical protein